MNDPDPILRNLKITQGYRDLSVGMAHLLGNHNVNWATFATWASKTAGLSIRKEDVPRFLDRFAQATKLDNFILEFEHDAGQILGPDFTTSSGLADVMVLAVLAPEITCGKKNCS